MIYFGWWTFLNIVQIICSLPLAPHQILFVDTGGHLVIQIPGYDRTTTKLSINITTLPTSGTIHQLSQVFSTYGYEPKIGTQIISENTQVTGSRNRIVYKRPFNDNNNQKGYWDVFRYVSIYKDTVVSSEGIITIVPLNGILVNSDFTFDNDGWTIIGNKVIHSSATFDTTNRGGVNRFIYGVDDKVDIVPSSGNDDNSLWYFSAPSKFMGHFGMAYGGYFEFTLSSFSGDFSSSNLNGGNINLVYLKCNSCNNWKGITLAYPLSSTSGYFGGDKLFSIRLFETSGWLKDPQNNILKWNIPTQCEMIQMLSSLSSVSILGDYTRWYETIALDNVQFRQTKSYYPICAEYSTDSSVCYC